MGERERCDRIGTEGCLTGNGSLLLVTLGFRVIVPRYAGLQRPESWAAKIIPPTATGSGSMCEVIACLSCCSMVTIRSGSTRRSTF
jgi:hypothetical protein